MSLLSEQPERMTNRAKLFLLTATVQHGALAAVCLLWPHLLASKAYEPASVFTWVAWGLAFAGVAAVCAWAAVTSNERLGRTGLAMSAVASGMWAAGFLLAFVLLKQGLVGAVAFAVLMLKDLVALPDPLRAPMEPVVRRVLPRSREQP